MGEETVGLTSCQGDVFVASAYMCFGNLLELPHSSRCPGRSF